MAEKLLARRLGIDDRALECLKLTLSREYVAELFRHGPWEWHLDSANDERLELQALVLSDLRPVFRVVVSRARLASIESGLDQFQAPFSELFGKLYVNASRYVMASGGAVS
jgi:hypothetical protein